MVIEPHMKQGRQHKLISTIFLATSVTKKLDHNSPSLKERLAEKKNDVMKMDTDSKQPTADKKKEAVI